MEKTTLKNCELLHSMTDCALFIIYTWSALRLLETETCRATEAVANVNADSPVPGPPEGSTGNLLRLVRNNLGSLTGSLCDSTEVEWLDPAAVQTLRQYLTTAGGQSNGDMSYDAVRTLLYSA